MNLFRHSLAPNSLAQLSLHIFSNFMLHCMHIWELFCCELDLQQWLEESLLSCYGSLLSCMPQLQMRRRGPDALAASTLLNH